MTADARRGRDAVAVGSAYRPHAPRPRPRPGFCAPLAVVAFPALAGHRVDGAKQQRARRRPGRVRCAEFGGLPPRAPPELVLEVRNLEAEVVEREPRALPAGRQLPVDVNLASVAAGAATGGPRGPEGYWERRRGGGRGGPRGGGEEGSATRAAGGSRGGLPRGGPTHGLWLSGSRSRPRPSWASTAAHLSHCQISARRNSVPGAPPASARGTSSSVGAPAASAASPRLNRPAPTAIRNSLSVTSAGATPTHVSCGPASGMPPRGSRASAMTGSGNTALTAASLCQTSTRTQHSLLGHRAVVGPDGSAVAGSSGADRTGPDGTVGRGAGRGGGRTVGPESPPGRWGRRRRRPGAPRPPAAASAGAGPRAGRPAPSGDRRGGTGPAPRRPAPGRPRSAAGPTCRGRPAEPPHGRPRRRRAARATARNPGPAEPAPRTTRGACSRRCTGRAGRGPTGTRTREPRAPAARAHRASPSPRPRRPAPCRPRPAGIWPLAENKKSVRPRVTVVKWTRA